MVHYKLYYFPIRGLAESIRQLFLIAGKEFEDKQVTMEEWPNVKDDMPLGVMPVLEVDGAKISQSMTIMRFLGREFDLCGKTSVQAAQLDTIGEIVHEMVNAPGYILWGRVLLGMIKEDKAEFFKEKVVPDVEKYAPTIERFLVLNGGNGVFIGDDVTWVDVYAAELFSRVIDFGLPNALDAYPNILTMIHRIHSIKSIKERIESRGDQIC